MSVSALRCTRQIQRVKMHKGKKGYLKRILCIFVIYQNVVKVAEITLRDEDVRCWSRCRAWRSWSQPQEKRGRQWKRGKKADAECPAGGRLNRFQHHHHQRRRRARLRMTRPQSSFVTSDEKKGSFILKSLSFLLRSTVNNKCSLHAYINT